MNDCEVNHLACTQRVNPGLPLRLLRVTWPTDMIEHESPHVRLEMTAPGRTYQYVALSHVWTNTKPLMTVKSNVEEYGNQVPWDQLSQAIREAVILTLALGLEYIWIDSLCIIQKDDLDWENELPRMSNIYGNAAVVFAVHGPDLGFHRAPVLPIRDIGRPDDNPVYCRQKIDHRSIFCAPTDAESWFGRAWCMQERIFARRILHFGGFCEELYFECNTEVSCECSRVNKTSTVTEEEGRTLKAQVTSATALIKDQPESAHIGHQLWRLYVTCCEDYSARGVTFATDTLPAVSALMSSLAPYFGNYYAGLWQSHLLLCLQWEALYTSECSRHEKFVAPSFSWASRSGAVTWYMDLSKMPTKDTHDFAAVVDVACTVKGKDPFGGVSAGYVTLRGPLTEMSIASKDLFGPDDRMKMTKKGAKECYVTLDSREDIQEVYLGMMVTCLDVMRDKNGRFVSSLVLLPLDPLSRKFRRIGFSTMLVEHFDGASQEEITII